MEEEEEESEVLKELVEKVQREDRKPLYDEEKRERVCERKRKQKGSPTSQSETNPGEDWEVAPSPFAHGGRVGHAAEGPQRRREAMVRMQQEVQVKGSRLAEEIPQRWRQPKGGRQD